MLAFLPLRPILALTMLVGCAPHLSAQTAPSVTKDAEGNLTVTFPTERGRLYSLEAAPDGINFAPVPGRWLYGSALNTGSFLIEPAPDPSFTYLSADALYPATNRRSVFFRLFLGDTNPSTGLTSVSYVRYFAETPDESDLYSPTWDSSYSYLYDLYADIRRPDGAPLSGWGMDLGPVLAGQVDLPLPSAAVLSARLNGGTLPLTLTQGGLSWRVQAQFHPPEVETLLEQELRTNPLVPSLTPFHTQTEQLLAQLVPQLLGHVANTAPGTPPIIYPPGSDSLAGARLRIRSHPSHLLHARIPDTWFWLNGYESAFYDPSVFDADGDSDGDGLSNLMEFYAGTIPIGSNGNADSDNDGISDDWERFFAGDLSTLFDTSDADSDLVFDLYEFQNYGNPLLKDTAADGWGDKWKKDTDHPPYFSKVPTDTLRLSEVCADNAKSLRIAIPGVTWTVTTDWIEIENPTADPISLNGWQLISKTNSGADVVFTFPSGHTLAAQAHTLILFDNNSQLQPHLPLAAYPFVHHSGLSASGEIIRLVNPTGDTVSAFLLGYPALKEDQTFALDSFTRTYGYCASPTPGLPNTTKIYRHHPFPGFAPQEGRVFTSPTDAGAASLAHRTLTREPGYAFGLYTTDGTDPIPGNPSALLLNQQNFTEIFPSGKPAILRARSWKGFAVGSQEHFRSLLLPEQTLLQAAPSLPYPSHWAPGQAWYYEMSRPVVQALGATQVAASLRALPTVSLQVAPSDLFGSQGIMRVTAGRGDSWRKDATFEFLNPTASGSQLLASSLATLEIHGGSSRYLGTTQKQSFELKFKRPESGKLEAPLFNTPARPGSTHNHQKFSKLLLTTPTHDSWAVDKSISGTDWGWLRQHATYVKDTWAAATEREMGLTTPRRQWVHLYLNGLYWGVYELREDLNADFLADNAPPATSTLPQATDDDYDVIKDNKVQAGSGAAWEELLSKLHLLGQASDPDASPLLTEVSQKLDLTALADYLLLNVLMNNEDWPRRNWVAYRTNKLVSGADGDTKFRFRCWDAQWSFLPPGANPNAAAPIGSTWERIATSTAGPGYAYLVLSRTNLFTNLLLTRETALRGGTAALADATVAQRFAAQRALFQPGILAEYSRWGGWRDAFITSSTGTLSFNPTRVQAAVQNSPSPTVSPTTAPTNPSTAPVPPPTEPENSYSSFSDELLAAVNNLEILDSNKNPTQILKVAKMTNDGVLTGTEPNMILNPEADPDRFYVRLKGGAKYGAVTVRVFTQNNEIESYNDPGAWVTLGVIEGEDLISNKSLLLVSDNADDIHPVDGVKDGDDNDRTFKIQLGGKLSLGELQLPTDEGDPPTVTPAEVLIEKILTVEVFVLKNAVGVTGAPVITPTDLEADFRVANERYAQIGVKIVFTHGQGHVIDPPLGVNLSDGFQETSTTDATTGVIKYSELAPLCNFHATPSDSDIQVFYVNNLPEYGNAARTGYVVMSRYRYDLLFAQYPSAAIDVKNQLNTIIISKLDKTPFTLAHELGHVLDMHDVTKISTDPHYDDEKNLLHPTVPENTIGATKRLDEAQEFRSRNNTTYLTSP